MGYLVQGQWQAKPFEINSKNGHYQRASSKFNQKIGDVAFPAEKGRYHLYVSLACPWAHRTLIFRRLKQLTDYIDVSIVSPDMLEQGWTFKNAEGKTSEPLYGFDHLHQLYTKAKSDYSGRATVPVLWDKKQETIVNNESAEIIRMFNGAFNQLTGDEQDFYPKALREEIDAVNERVYQHVNNGVYKCGFAQTQEAYEEAFNHLFDELDELEKRLSKQVYLVGDQLTEADWRLFTTLIRFDAVYFGHFKANLKRIRDYKFLSAYVRALYHYPGIKETVNFEHIKRHYYYSHIHINPSQIVPKGPELDYLGF